MKNALRTIFILFLSLGSFLFVSSFTHLAWWAGIAVAAGVFVLMSLIIPKSKEDKDIVLTAGVSRADYNRVQEQGRQSVQSLKKMAFSLADKEMAQKLKDIADLVQKIFDQLKKEPADIPRAKDFLEYYLIKGMKIIENYVYLSKQPLSDEQQKKLEEAVATIYVIESGFRQVYEKSLADNFDSLTVEGKTLEDVMRIEIPDFAKVMDSKNRETVPAAVTEKSADKSE